MAAINIQEILGGKPPDPEEAKKAAKKLVIQANKQYMRFLEETIKFIDELDPKDRLDFAFGISLIINVLYGSIKGWQKWSDFKNMRTIKDEEFREIYPKMKRIMKEWVAIDLEITDAKTKEMEVELGLETEDENGKKPTRKLVPKDKEVIYVA